MHNTKLCAKTSKNSNLTGALREIAFPRHPIKSRSEAISGAVFDVSKAVSPAHQSCPPRTGKKTERTVARRLSAACPGMYGTTKQSSGFYAADPIRQATPPSLSETMRNESGACTVEALRIVPLAANFCISGAPLADDALEFGFE